MYLLETEPYTRRRGDSVSGVKSTGRRVALSITRQDGFSLIELVMTITIMTILTMGVIPLVLSTGAGSEMRQAIGIAVFFGMLGVTAFGLVLTPVFYVVIQRLAEGRDRTKSPAGAKLSPTTSVEA